MRRAAFGRRQIEMRWQILHEISGDCYEARGNRGRSILEEELFEGQMALPDDLLVFLDVTEI
jgi:hypothetical protein